MSADSDHQDPTMERGQAMNCPKPARTSAPSYRIGCLVAITVVLASGGCSYSVPLQSHIRLELEHSEDPHADVRRFYEVLTETSAEFELAPTSSPERGKNRIVVRRYPSVAKIIDPAPAPKYFGEGNLIARVGLDDDAREVWVGMSVELGYRHTWWLRKRRLIKFRQAVLRRLLNDLPCERLHTGSNGYKDVFEAC